MTTNEEHRPETWTDRHGQERTTCVVDEQDWPCGVSQQRNVPYDEAIALLATKNHQVRVHHDPYGVHEDGTVCGGYDQTDVAEVTELLESFRK